ncbi:MAG: hypothetical protein DWQ21_11650 [Bacteroidetes bacterium]|nr:MAG: hypothetical protein DWQ21_11650 [Bacteroidota bacterium]REK64317.1 MAG: hypothetical protein DWQ49_01610 [Bacteroidota bacterium]
MSRPWTSITCLRLKAKVHCALWVLTSEI